MVGKNMFFTIKGVKGDKINPILAASGYNMRKFNSDFHKKISNRIRNIFKYSKKWFDPYFSDNTKDISAV
jgi:hypothetical protein